MAELTVKQTEDGSGGTIVALSGRMSEGADYRAIKVAGATAISIDFEEITMINSKGVQLWKDFMQGLPGGITITYLRCPLKIVNQLNLFPSLNGGKSVHIASYYAPYFCSKCDEGRVLLMDADKTQESARSGEAVPAQCKVCGTAMEFDANPQKYFLFLRRAAAGR